MTLIIINILFFCFFSSINFYNLHDHLIAKIIIIHFSIAKIVHSMRGRGHRGDLGGLIISLGAGKHDLKLLDSWSLGLPSNPA